MTSTAGMFGGGWLWLQLPAIASLAACAREAAVQDAAFTTLTAGEGRAMRAFAARILPSGDGLPGAEEAGAAWFADGALGGPMAQARDLIGEGLANLDARAMAEHSVLFADASADRQDALMYEVEETEFFFVARLLTVAGVFADPSHGGNRDHAGFTLLEMEHAPAFRPPFGWYDEQYVRERGSAGGAV